LSTNLNEQEASSSVSLNIDSSSKLTSRNHHHHHHHHHHSQLHPNSKATRSTKNKRLGPSGGELTASPTKRRSLKSRRNKAAEVNYSGGEEVDSEGDEAANADSGLKHHDLLKSATVSALETSKLSIDLNKVSFNLSQQQQQQSGFGQQKSTANSGGRGNNPSRLISSQSNASSVGGVEILIIVVHGGNVTCTDMSKQSDFTNFRTTMDRVIRANHEGFSSRIAYRLVACEPICKDALIKLAT
jgi:hypothetical protein